MSVQSSPADQRDLPEGASGTRTDARPGPERRKRSTAEWTTLVAVLLILGAVVGSLIWYAVRPGEREATFDVAIEQAAIEERGGLFYVPLRLHNTGAATAEEVVVRAAIMQGDEAIEETELTFGFVAGGEEAEGVAVFTKDPRQAEIEARVVSYLKP